MRAHSIRTIRVIAIMSNLDIFCITLHASWYFECYMAWVILVFTDEHME